LLQINKAGINKSPTVCISLYHSRIFEQLSSFSYDTIAEFNVDSKAEYSALSSIRSQKKELKQTTPVPLWYSTG